MNLFLLASGLSLIYGVLGVVNFAHGSFYLIGAYFCYTCAKLCPFWFAFVIAPLAVGALGIITELCLLRKVYQSEHIYQLLLTWGLVLVFGDLCKLVWGVDKKTLGLPTVLAEAMRLFGTKIPLVQIFATLVAAIVAALLIIVLYKTRIGALIRAAAADPEVTSALGVDTRKVYTAVFGVGCWLAGLGGAVSALLMPIYAGSDLELVLVAFIIVVIGGMGSIIGSLVGSLITGLLYALGILLVPRFALAFLYVLMVGVLIIRPWGLLGRPQID
ncbi:MAG: branched-chain amino acid ABC transporter permease [Deltaproteobacteria bacterium]|nr:branched-chain amino acid ABC transporter permease [Deltaproteobacteria bacterium]